MNTTTARVDIERLQILNDRLCQTLDALNQVRLSAHNVSYSPMAQPFYSQPIHGQLNQMVPAFGGYSPNTAWGYTQALPQTVTPFHAQPQFGFESIRPSFLGSTDYRFGGSMINEGLRAQPFVSAQPAMF